MWNQEWYEIKNDVKSRQLTDKYERGRDLSQQAKSWVWHLLQHPPHHLFNRHYYLFFLSFFLTIFIHNYLFFFLSFLFSFFLTIFDYPPASSCPQCQNLKINALMHLIALDKYSMWESYGSNKGMAFPISHAREKCICFKLTFSISQNASTSSLIHIIKEYLHNAMCHVYPYTHAANCSPWAQIH